MTILSTRKSKKIANVFAICISVFLLGNSFIFFPHNNFKYILDKLQSFLNSENREVLYLHTNGSRFESGDTIWFKAYNLRSGLLIPSTKSNMLHVSLNNYNGTNEITGKYKLVLGLAHGQIELPDSLPGGKYLLTAGSNSTLCEFPDDIFKKEIVIQKAKKDAVIIKVSIPDSIFAEQNIIQGELEVIGENNARLGQIRIKLLLKQGQNILKKEFISTGEEGVGKFDLLIPDDLGSEAVCIYAQIQHGRLDADLTVNIPIDSLPPIIRFFPEGGQIIEGINTKVAFEATDNSGNPFDFKGEIIDSEGQIITDFKTTVFGMGSGDVLMQKEKKLFLQILEPTGYKYKYELPQANAEGYSLHIINNTTKEVSLKVESNSCSPNDSVSVLIYLRDKIWFTTTKQLKDLYHLSIPIISMPMGVAVITVFDKNGIPRAERLLFINGNKRLYIAESLEYSYDKKEKINVTINLRNKFNEPVSGIFSMSVSPVSFEKDQIWSNNIMSSLFLSDYLKGEIPARGYYFSENPDSKKALDLLMLTHGWRKFKWENILGFNKKIVKNECILKGVVTTRKGKPVKYGEVTLMNVNTFYVVTTVTDKNGRFCFDNTDYQNMLDYSKLMLTATTAGGKKNVVINMDGIISEGKMAYFTEFSLNENLKNFKTIERINEINSLELDSTTNFSKKYYSDFTKRNILIDDVEVKVKRPVVIPIEVFEKEHMFYELDDKEININFGYNEQSGIVQLLHQVAGSFKVVPGGKILFRGYNSLYPETMQGAVFVIDGRVAGFSYHDLNHLNADDIENIKVTKSSAAGLKYSAYATGGLVEITTKGYNNSKRKSVPVKTDENIISIKGYSLQKEFYSPVYKNAEAKSNTIDLRTTLFWEPNLTVNDSGQTSLEYFNSDIPGEYELRIEGISKSGIPFYHIERYFVEN